MNPGDAYVLVDNLQAAIEAIQEWKYDETAPMSGPTVTALFAAKTDARQALVDALVRRA